MAYLIVIWEYQSEICSKVHLSVRHRDRGRAAGHPLCVVPVSAEDTFVLLVVSRALLHVPVLGRTCRWLEGVRVSAEPHGTWGPHGGICAEHRARPKR